MSLITLNSIRTQVDLVLSYTFFCDHPKEWAAVTTSGNGFLLKKEIINYHKEMDNQFMQRLKILEEASAISLDKIYRILSAQIHGQSPYTVPKHLTIQELICTEELMTSIVQLQKSTITCLSNFLLAIHSPNWPELPEHVVGRARITLTPNQVPIVFP